LQKVQLWRSSRGKRYLCNILKDSIAAGFVRGQYY
jgi:hypothetical protein